jgi:hypothetical protein
MTLPPRGEDLERGNWQEMASDNPLGLSVPETTYAPDNTFFLDLKKIQTWLSSLPMANIGETSRQVFKTLVELNRLEVPNLNRIKAVELFRQPITYISSNLKKHYFDQPFPLSARNQKVSVLCREFHSELANSYKHIITNIISEGREEVDQRLLIIAVHQALYYLHSTLRHSALVYNPYPENVWKEIHRLFSYATDNNINAIKVKESTEKEGASSTITDLYKRSLLLAMIPPYKLRQREIDYLFKRLPEYASYLQLTNPNEQDKKDSQFIVPANSDEPPLHISLHTAPLTEVSRVIDTASLVKQLQNELKTVTQAAEDGEKGNMAGQLAKPLLEKMVLSLGTAPQRKFVRTKLNFELDIAVGLGAIHALIIEHAKGDQEPEEGPEVREEITLTITPLDQPFEDTGFVTDDTVDVWSGETTFPTPWTQSVEEKTYETYHCRTFNESAGGYCIDLSGRDAPKIRVGELVGIQSASDKAQFSIGVTRWIKNLPIKGLEFGIEVVSLDAFSASVSHTKATGSLAAQQDALLLPEQKVSKHPNSIIVPALPYQVKDILLLEDSEGKKTIQLTKLVEITGSFARFEFFIQDTIKNEAPTREEKEKEEDTDFDKIWDIL